MKEEHVSARDFFARSDWAALRSSGVLVEGAKPPRRDSTAVASKIHNHLSDHAIISSEDEFRDKGITLRVFVHQVLGMPEEAKPEAIETVEGWVTAALKATAEGPVQHLVDGKGWLVKGS